MVIHGFLKVMSYDQPSHKYTLKCGPGMLSMDAHQLLGDNCYQAQHLLSKTGVKWTPSSTPFQQHLSNAQQAY